MTNWIACVEQMPQLTEIVPDFWESDFVLVARVDSFYGSHIDVMHYRGSKDDMLWEDGNDIYLRTEQVTHWAQLPDRPTQSR
ncbi:MAG: hypothetical protein JWO52_7820 [Gammaproteobacteria bacterium]|nr:hypothetical protein [Gammaproteobacteria bacterium]